MKKKLSQKILEYTIVFEPADEGGYIASVPALPGCATQGETFEESVEMIKDAISGYLEVLNETGEKIPEENKEVVIAKVSVHNPQISI